MKHIYGLFFLFLFFDSIIFAQKDNDVVYLKDGSIIRGMIIEQSPNEYIKIKSGENVFVYEINEIEKMAKETPKDLGNKTWTTHFGFGNPRGLNLFGISKDFPVSKKFSFYLTAGLGTAIVGAGFCFENNYGNKGIIFSTTLGHNSVDRSLNLNLGYQWKLPNNHLLSLGINTGAYVTIEQRLYIPDDEFGMFGWKDNYVTNTYVIPSISYNYRF